MSIKKHIQKIFQYYTRDYFFSGIAFTLTYLSIFLIFSFSSVIETRVNNSYTKTFGDASFIFSASEGISFYNSGDVNVNNSISTGEVTIITQFLSKNNFNFLSIKSSDSLNTAYIIIFGTTNISCLFDFCKENNIQKISSFNSKDSDFNNETILYDVNGLGNRFNVFSFKNQISSFVLNSEFSTTIGRLSRMVFTFSLIFSFYLSLIYFKEKQAIYRVLLLQGYSDLSLKLLLVEYLIINLTALIFASLMVVVILFILKINIGDGLGGILYSIPYIPVIILIQVIILFNNSLKYLRDE